MFLPMALVATSALRPRWRLALDTCRSPATLRKSVRIALVVGCTLTAINQADVLIEGKATAITAVKIVLNFVVSFIVSNLGALAAAGARHER
jgi:hypothetical protein